MATHLNPHLVPNVKCTLSPFLAFLNKCPPPLPRRSEGELRLGDMDVCECVQARVCVCASNLAFIFINLSFLNSLISPPDAVRARAPATEIVSFFSLCFLSFAQVGNINTIQRQKQKQKLDCPPWGWWGHFRASSTSMLHLQIFSL